jgi:L-threonylcarbamoyladenylate synthase
VVTTLAVEPFEPERRVLDAAIRVLRDDGIVAFPTETFYGLAVDARSRSACERLYALKGRPPEKAFPCIVSGIPQLEEVALALDESALILAERFWPGPLTLLVEARPGLAASAPDGSIAVRASGLPLARELAVHLGAPVTATSANRSGSDGATSAAEVMSQLGSGVDLILDGGLCPGGLPSTIVDVRRVPPRLVRAGRVPFEEIQRALTCAPRKLQ